MMTASHNVLLLGSGGREHALALTIAKSSRVLHVYVAPGNGGIPSSTSTSTAINKISSVPSLAVNDTVSQLTFCVNHSIDMVVVGPEQPLVNGCVDMFMKAGIECFGPMKAAAQLEASKAFSKTFMDEHNIPTAIGVAFNDVNEAKEYVKTCGHRVVIKASGLAAGKGVVMAEDVTAALAAIDDMMVQRIFGNAGDTVLVEEWIEGEEISVLAFTDGYTVVAFPSAQDHKRINDNDSGLNTGGMGAYAPVPAANNAIMKVVHRDILQPTVDGMRKAGTPYRGVLFVGIMLTSTGPKVLEYNCRMGDPETQVVLALLADDTDFFDVLKACVGGYLDAVPISFRNAYAATVILASGGYPGAYNKGEIISLPSEDNMPVDSMLYHAGTKQVDGRIETSGGRVLACSGVGATLQAALESAYKLVDSVKFSGMHFRTDIGRRGLCALVKDTEGRLAQTTYADAGVSIDAGNEFVEQIKPYTKATRRSGCDAELGGFGALFDLKAAGYSKDAILVSSTDGVGTKLRIAQLTGFHETIGVDLVAMCANDLVVQGAEPLFFLDYFASGKLEVNVAVDVVKGIALGCTESGCALTGGETAEMPGMYAPGHYDLAGFVVGAVERDGIVPSPERPMVAGDVIIGLASSGLHSNGFSLVRHIIEKCNLSLHSSCPYDSGNTLGRALLVPTRLYVKSCLEAVRTCKVKGLAHITGGGFTENIPRMLPKGVTARLDASTWPLLPVFRWLMGIGGITHTEMARTYNCGIGMVIAVERSDVDTILNILRTHDEKAYVIGVLEAGDEVKVDNTATEWLAL